MSRRSSSEGWDLCWGDYDFALRLLQVILSSPSFSLFCLFCLFVFYTIFCFSQVVDFVSIVPFYVFLIVNATGIDASGAQFFSAVRVLRIFRLLKLDRLTRAFKLLKNAIFRTAEVLFVTLIMELILFLFVATLLWILEPKLYPSIPDAMFISLLMLTGADVPVSELKRIFLFAFLFNFFVYSLNLSFSAGK